jgi:glycosyltransferase involved in cell wall biosynthesis
MKNTGFCSVIIPTIGRDTLDRAVLSVLGQDFPKSGFEVIVVNDSGSALTSRDWHSASQVRILNTYRRERSFARNCGAAIAKGDYLAFLDDDDWLLPGAIDSFRELANRHPNADWLYGGIRIVDENNHCLAELNSGLQGNCLAQIVGGAWAPIQASLVKSQAFFEVGGFNPKIIGTEDEDLCRRIAYHGEFGNTTAVIACLFRGQDWATSTNYLRAPGDTRYSRDLVLSAPGAFSRLLRSSPNSYWSGRICRVYMSTVGWNLKHSKPLTALSRALFGSAAFIGSGLRVLSPDFWRGFKASHAPGTLHFVMQDYENRKQQETCCVLEEGEA